MASFWNPEAVKTIKETRSSKDQHNFSNNEDFEKQVVDREYKNNKYVQAIMELRKKNNTNNSEHNDTPENNFLGYIPRDLKFLKDY